MVKVLAAVSNILCALACFAGTETKTPYPMVDGAVRAGHRDAVYSVTINDRAGLIATAASRDIRVWDLQSGALKKVLWSESSFAANLAFTQKGTALARAASDGRVRTWDTRTWSIRHDFKSRFRSIESIAISPSGRRLAVSGVRTTFPFESRSVAMYDTSGGSELWHRRIDRSHKYLEFSDDEALLTTAGADVSPTVWDVKSGQATVQPLAKGRMTPTGPDDGVFLANGSSFAVVTAKGVDLWNRETGKLLDTLTPPHEFFESTYRPVSAMSRDGSVIVIAMENSNDSSSVVLWNTRIGTRLSNGRTPGTSVPFQDPTYISSSALSADGRTWVTGHRDGFVVAWNTADGERRWAEAPTTRDVREVSFSMDGKRMAFTQNGAIHLWDLVAGSPLGDPLFQGIQYSTLSPDGQSVAFVRGHGSKVNIYGVDDRRERSLDLLGDNSSSPRYAGNVLIAYKRRGGLAISDPATESLIRELPAENAQKLLAIDHLGRRLATTTQAGQLAFWDLLQPDSPPTVLPLGLSVAAFALSPDGASFAVAEKDGDVLVFNLASLNHYSLPSRQAGVTALEFSSDGSRLVGGYADGTLRIWDLHHRTLKKVLRHPGGVGQLRAVPGKPMVASAGAYLCLWDVKEGRLLLTLTTVPKHRNKADWVAFTPEGFFDGTRAGWQELHFTDASGNSNPAEDFLRIRYEPHVLGTIVERASTITAILEMSGNPRAVAVRTGATSLEKPALRIVSPPSVEPGAPRPGSHAFHVISDRDAIPIPVGRGEPSASEKPQAPRQLKVVDVVLELTHGKGGMQDLRLFRNDVLVYTHRSTIPSDTTRLTVPVALQPGLNELRAYAFSEAGVKSDDSKIWASSPVVAPRKAYLVVIGIDSYAHSSFPELTHAAADAKEVLSTLSDTLSGAFSVVPVPLLNEDATKRGILRALENISGGSDAAKPVDLVLFYFAGHGIASGDRYYLIPHFAGFGGEDANVIGAKLGISDLELELAFEKIDAGKLLLIIDACHAGQALEAQEHRRGPLNTRGLAQMAYEKGMSVLAASQSYESALEMEHLGHGLLTSVLVKEGLKELKADRDPKNGQLTVSEWFDYAAEKVPSTFKDLSDRMAIRQGRAVMMEEVGQTPRVYHGDDGQWILTQ